MAPVALCLLLACPALAQQANDQRAGQEPITITLVNGNTAEQQTKAQIERLLETHDVDDWMFTREILVEADIIPHSHPTLTISTGDEDGPALSTLLHEQFHWYANEVRDRTEAAKRAFAEQFPDAPAGSAAGGARDLESTYLHLVVCDLELQAMTQLIGEADARAVLEGYNHYPWIYEQVLTNPVVRQINERHGMVVPERD